MLAKSKYVALGIFIGLALANVFPIIKESGSTLKTFLNILPFLLLFGMLIFTLGMMKKHDNKNKG